MGDGIKHLLLIQQTKIKKIFGYAIFVSILQEEIKFDSMNFAHIAVQ